MNAIPRVEADSGTVKEVEPSAIFFNDSIIKKDPVKLLIQPASPTNKVFGFPLGLSIYNLASENPDEKFEKWLLEKPNRYKRLSRLLSKKQIIQLKQYNNSFNKFLKNLGQKPTKISDTNVNENISRLKQFYTNEGYFDSKVSADTILNDNQAIIKYNVTTNTRYLIDTISINTNSRDIDSLTMEMQLVGLKQLIVLKREHILT